MINTKLLVKSVGKFASDNSTSILTGVAVAGVVTTTIFAVKATPKAMGLIEEAKEERDEDLTTLDKIRITYPCYIPAVGIGAVTIACVLGANAVSTKRSAALVGAYSALDTGFREYQEKVKEKIGETKEKNVRDEVAQDRVTRDKKHETVVLTGDGQVLCYDLWSGRYFQSTVESIRKAQNDLNAMLLNEMYASVNDFYGMLGLSGNAMGDEFGWNSDKLLEVEFSSALTEEDRKSVV